MKNIKIIVIFCCCLVLARANLYAQELTVLYTGQSHAMLYPCSCPVQADGGIARRASLVKELRKKDPQLLLLDCGNFTAGGLMDEYTQSVQLDMARTEVNLKSMGLIKYDAIAIGSDEFNFGKEFFLKNIKKDNPVYLSSNLEAEGMSPYLIKDIRGVKVAIIGLTSLAVRQKSEGLKVNEPKKIAELIKRLKNDGVAVVAILSTLGEQEDLKLISEVAGIDLVFIGQNPLKEESLTKIGSTFLVRPVWQARKLGRLILEVKDGKLVNCKLDEMRLSDQYPDDADILTILPRCYSDANCKNKGLIGSCQHPGELTASCSFKAPDKINLWVITAKDCSICNPDALVELLEKKFPGALPKYLYYPDPAAKKMVKDLEIQGLPAYVFGKEVAKDDNFYGVKDDLLSRGDLYLLKPQKTGIAYFFARPQKKGFDLFLSLFEKNSYQALEAARELNPTLHFLSIKTDSGFEAKNGPAEVEENLRGVCVAKYYPQKLWDYLSCRSKNIFSSYWEDCLGQLEPSKIKDCARGPEGAQLLKENIALNQELKIMFGPTYLLNNREVFATQGKVTKQGLKKLIKN